MQHAECTHSDFHGNCIANFIPEIHEITYIGVYVKCNGTEIFCSRRLQFYVIKSFEVSLNMVSSLQVGEVSTISTMYEDTIQAAGREKATLSTQLQESRKQLMAANEDLGKMRAEIDHEVRSALKGNVSACNQRP